MPVPLIARALFAAAGLATTFSGNALAQVTEPGIHTPDEFASLIRERREFFAQLLRNYNIPRQ